MPAFATIADVRSRVSYGEITDGTGGSPGDPGYIAPSQPSATEVGAWLDELSAEIRLMFTGLGLPTSFTAGTDQALLMTGIVANVAAGRCRQAWASSQGNANDDGEAAEARFRAWLEDVRRRPGYYGELLGAGTAPTESLEIAGITTLNFDGLDSSDSSFEPTIQRGRENF